MARSNKPAENTTTAAPAATPETESRYKKRRWAVPTKRARGYAAERKAKVHQHGPKEGKELTDYEAGIRSGYLQCQTDHAGLFKYKKALSEGKTKEEARAISMSKKNAN